MPRWRKEEDDAVAAIGAAREQPGAVYAAWPSLELTDRTLTGEQVKKRWHAIKSKYMRQPLRMSRRHLRRRPSPQNIEKGRLRWMSEPRPPE